MKNMFRIYPESGRYIPDILPNGKRIEEVTDMPLNRAEFLKCKAYATICALVGEPPKEVNVNTKTYEEAIAVFNVIPDTVEEIQKATEESIGTGVEDESPDEEKKEPETIQPEEDETPLEVSEPLPEADNTEKEFIPEEESVETEDVEEKVQDEDTEDSDTEVENEISTEHEDNRPQENSTQGQQTGYTSFDKKRNTQNKNKKKH